MMGLFDNKEKKLPFCNFECFGVVARFGLVELEVSKMKDFFSKKKINVR